MNLRIAPALLLIFPLLSTEGRPAPRETTLELCRLDFESSSDRRWFSFSDDKGKVEQRIATGELMPGGVLQLRSPPEPNNKARAALRCKDSESWRHYEVELDAAILSSTGSYAYFNLFVRLEPGSRGGDGYGFHLRALQDSVSLIRHQGGNNETLITRPLNVAIGKRYRLRAVASDDVLQLFVDGEKVLEAHDSAIGQGTVGFSTHGAGAETVTAAVDNVVVRSFERVPRSGAQPARRSEDGPH